MCCPVTSPGTFPTNAITAVAWIRLTSFSSTTDDGIMIYGTNSKINALTVQVNPSTGVLSGYVNNARWTTTTGVVSDSNWHSVAVVWKKSLASLQAYVDGTSVGSFSSSSANMQDTGCFTIGQYSNGSCELNSGVHLFSSYVTALAWKNDLAQVRIYADSTAGLPC